MSRKVEGYEAQAEKAAWRGTVAGKPAYVTSWRGQWEVCVPSAKDGTVMIPLANRAAIRNLAEAADPPLPDAVLKKALKAAKRDEPIRYRGAWRRRVLALALTAVLAAAAFAAARWLRGGP